MTARICGKDDRLQLFSPGCVFTPWCPAALQAAVVLHLHGHAGAARHVRLTLHNPHIRGRWHSFDRLRVYGLQAAVRPHGLSPLPGTDRAPLGELANGCGRRLLSDVATLDPKALAASV